MLGYVKIYKEAFIAINAQKVEFLLLNILNIIQKIQQTHLENMFF